MNESGPSQEAVVSIDDWKSQKELAPSEAKNLISQIEGYEGMESTDKILALKGALEGLEEDNANRFLAVEIARLILILEEVESHSNRLSELEAAAQRVINFVLLFLV